MAALPYRDFEDMIAGMFVTRAMQGVLENEGTLTTAFDLAFLGKVIGRLIDLGLFDEWSKPAWLDGGDEQAQGGDTTRPTRDGMA